MNFTLKADEILVQQPDNISPLAAKTSYNYMHGSIKHSYNTDKKEEKRFWLQNWKDKVL